MTFGHIEHLLLGLGDNININTPTPISNIKYKSTTDIS